MQEYLPIGNLEKLQQALEQVINKIGVQKTIMVLENISQNTTIEKSETVKIKLIIAHIIHRCVLQFDLNEKEFHSSSIREYKEARMVCYYLIHDLMDCSYAKIGELFGLKKRNVMYACHKCKELLESPQIHKKFVARYSAIETNTIQFIGELN